MKRLLKIFKFFLKTKFIFSEPDQHNLVIFDGESMDDLSHILFKYKFFILQNRIELIDKIYLSTKIIKLCFKNYKGNIMSAYLISLLEIISPKVVFTFIDNSLKFSEVAKVLDKKMIFLALQQGARHDFMENQYMYKKKIISYDENKIFYIPNLLCLGQHEINDYKKSKIKVKNFYKAGSLRLDNFFIHIKNKPIQNFKKIYDIALISDSDAWDQRMESEEIKERVILLTKYTIKFSIKNKMRMTLALKRSKPKKNTTITIDSFNRENELYKKYLTKAEYNYVSKKFNFKKNKYISYNIMLKSKVVIGSMSTMLRENLALGGKILACNLTPGDFYDFPIKGICSIKNFTYEQFEKRLLNILSISNKKYYSKLRKNKDYTCYNNKNISTIAIVQKKLDLLLK